MLTWLEISQSAIEHNLRQFRRIVGPKVMLMPAVKGNAYGHGIVDVAKILDRNKDADRICVVDLDEALLLLNSGIKKPIMILSFYELDEHKLCSAVKSGVIFPLYDINQARFLNRIGERIDKKVLVHVKIDTGASRLGVMPSDAVNFVKKVKKFKQLAIEGIYSHYAASEEDKLYTENQLRIFNQVIENLDAANIRVPIKHLTCSAASVLHRQSHFNAVRIGLGMFGLYPDDLTRKQIQLRPALSWYTTVMQVKTVPPWTKISYGGTYTTKKTTKLAILPVGYYDGFDRSLGNKAQVIIGGKLCPIRGRICMNMCMADVTAVPAVRVGDKVVIIGKMGTQSLSADDLAKWADTINYEIVDRINPLLPRIIKK